MSTQFRFGLMRHVSLQLIGDAPKGLRLEEPPRFVRLTASTPGKFTGVSNSFAENLTPKHAPVFCGKLGRQGSKGEHRFGASGPTFQRFSQRITNGFPATWLGRNCADGDDYDRRLARIRRFTWLPLFSSNPTFERTSAILGRSTFCRWMRAYGSVVCARRAYRAPSDPVLDPDLRFRGRRASGRAGR